MTKLQPPMAPSLCFSPLLIFLIMLLLQMPKTTSAVPPTPPSLDCQILLSIMPTLGIERASKQISSSWNSSVDCCKWLGVTCGEKHQERITSLTLNNSNLAGTIPSSLANLTFLRSLDLSENHLHGIIPPALGKMKRLQFLYLHSNSMEGSIPSTLGSLSKLQELQLSKNHFHGSLPESLFNLTGLSYLALGENNLTGTLSPSIVNMSSLQFLELRYNQLGGSIPVEVGAQMNLILLDLLFNHFTGQVPPSLFNSSNLFYLGLASNNFSGSLPPDMGNHLPELDTLHLYNNRLEGPIPTTITNASMLSSLYLGNNSFRGVVPHNIGLLDKLKALSVADNQLEAHTPSDWSFITSMSRCHELEEIDITRNRFRGPLPESIGNLSKTLTWLRLRKNFITGGIPPTIGNLTGLLNLDIELNNLTGTVPSTLGNLLQLNALILRSNMISGDIPPSLGNLQNLVELYLDTNKFTGVLPGSFANLTKLGVFDMSHNSLSGAIPGGVLAVSSLSDFLNLSHNSFVGSLPLEVGKLKNLKTLDVSHNGLSGTLPSTIGECQLMDYLNLRRNAFNGTIPQQMSNLKGVQILDLSQNQFTGAIPEFLGNLPILKFLNLSFNNLEGEVPTVGIFSNISAFSIIGNPNLCGGDPRLGLRPCSSKKDGLSKPVLIAVSVAGALVFSLIILLILFLARRHRRARKEMDDDDDLFEDGGEDGWDVHMLLRLSYEDLSRATDGFSHYNLIGAGAFGSVYKGVLKQKGKLVAVKVFHKQTLSSTKTFLDECKVLKKVRHRNLVNVLTACSRMGIDGEEFKALVYEFMVNGNLDMWIHKGESAEKPLVFGNLNLLLILNIAIDVASGLEYLHNQLETSIVHCDLKPSNILLNEDMTACIGDFGISRILPREAELLISTGVKGTIGYIPPESAMGCRITTSWDVYSYGIVLLEMLTGKRPTDVEEGITIQQHVENSFPEHITDIVDKNLLYDENDAGIIEGTNECLTLAFGTALACSRAQPKERIRIIDALKQLEEAKGIYLEVRKNQGMRS